jgi:hypothetical protein
MKRFSGIAVIVLAVLAVGERAWGQTQPQTIRYKNILAQKVKDLVTEAGLGDAEAVAADELGLPTPALPLLQEQLNRKDLSPEAIAAIRDALEADKERLQRGIAVKKRLDWFYDQTLAVFDKTVDPKAKWRQPARSSIGAYVRVWDEDPGDNQ